MRASTAFVSLAFSQQNSFRLDCTTRRRVLWIYNINTLAYYFIAGSWAKYCNQRVSVCLFVGVFVRSNISKTTFPNFKKFSVPVTCGRALAWSSSGDSALPVLWMTSCFQPVAQNEAGRYGRV